MEWLLPRPWAALPGAADCQQAAAGQGRCGAQTQGPEGQEGPPEVDAHDRGPGRLGGADHDPGRELARDRGAAVVPGALADRAGLQTHQTAAAARAATL